jgi:hypothetical protein
LASSSEIKRRMICRFDSSVSPALARPGMACHTAPMSVAYRPHCTRSGGTCRGGAGKSRRRLSPAVGLGGNFGQRRRGTTAPALCRYWYSHSCSRVVVQRH